MLYTYHHARDAVRAVLQIGRPDLWRAFGHAGPRRDRD